MTPWHLFRICIRMSHLVTQKWDPCLYSYFRFSGLPSHRHHLVLHLFEKPFTGTLSFHLKQFSMQVLCFSYAPHDGSVSLMSRETIFLHFTYFIFARWIRISDAPRDGSLALTFREAYPCATCCLSPPLFSRCYLSLPRAAASPC